MTRYGAAPQWALDLAAEVCAAHGKPVPSIHWATAKGRWSGGSTGLFGTLVRIQAGDDPVDQKLVLLHELAHVVVPWEDGHSARFWDTAFALFRQYGLPLERVEREFGYKRQAVRAAARAGYITAEQAEDLELCHDRAAQGRRPSAHYEVNAYLRGFGTHAWMPTELLATPKVRQRMAAAKARRANS